jgi:hypothetical protein
MKVSENRSTASSSKPPPITASAMNGSDQQLAGAPLSTSSSRHHADDHADQQRACNRAQGIASRHAFKLGGECLDVLLADDARSDPVSTMPLVALPICEATVWLTLRAVFVPTFAPSWVSDGQPLMLPSAYIGLCKRQRHSREFTRF